MASRIRFIVRVGQRSVRGGARGGSWRWLAQQGRVEPFGSHLLLDGHERHADVQHFREAVDEWVLYWLFHLVVGSGVDGRYRYGSPRLRLRFAARWHWNGGGLERHRGQLEGNPKEYRICRKINKTTLTTE